MIITQSSFLDPPLDSAIVVPMMFAHDASQALCLTRVIMKKRTGSLGEPIFWFS
jgi:hypothetical protein